MMYCELLALTDNKATNEQFIEIEAVYMSREAMTKEQAARLWKRRYGEKMDKPRAAEMRRIKESIRDFKNERKWAKVMERRIIANYDERISESITGYGITLEELDALDGSKFTVAWLARQSIERLTKERVHAINKWYDDAGNDTHIYIIYTDGSICIALGTEIVAGEITPAMQHIAYAHYHDGWEEFDTFIGNFEVAFPYSDDFTDEEENEHWENIEAYKSSVEIKFETEWGKRRKAM